MFFTTAGEEEKNNVELTDEEVLFASQKNPRMFEVLVERYQDAFIRRARHILGNKEEAEDIVQETFTKMYIYGGKFQVQEGASFKSWGYKILINTCFTHCKKKKLHNERFTQINPEFEHLIADKNNDFESYTTKEHILSILSCMPDPLAKVLEDYFIKGIPQKEMAEEEGVSISAIKTRVHRAKKVFKTCLGFHS